MGSFGERLQREREMRGITLEEIADSTKIGTRSLRALEQEDFDKLPGGIFNKGFVRAYARYLGIDEEQAVADFLAAAGEPEQPLPSPFPREKQAPASSHQGWAVILSVLGLAAVLWGGRYIYERSQRSEPTSPPQTQVEPQKPPPTSPPAPAAQTGGEAGTVASTPAESSGNPAAVQPAAGEGFVLRVRAKEDTWLSITADGHAVMEGTLAAADSREVRAKKSVVLKLGNAAGVEVSHNGTAVPPLGRANEVKTVVFTPEGLQP
ncbi:MAG: helix-turn-helix domain-containing protein [Terriglobales bacterium]